MVGYFSLRFILLEVAIFFEVKEKSHYLSSGFDALMWPQLIFVLKNVVATDFFIEIHCESKTLPLRLKLKIHCSISYSDY